jgi:hypothetical protein
MRTGDTAKDISTGKDWTVAWADDSEVVLGTGYSQVFARPQDVELVRTCTEEEHWALVKKMAEGHGIGALHCFKLLHGRTPAVSVSRGR